MYNGPKPQFATDIYDADAWKALISAFLESKTDLSDTNLDVTTTSSQVTITISDARILAMLDDIFKSPKATHASLQYSLHEIDKDLSQHAVTGHLFDDTQMQAHEVISHLFAKDLLEECDIDEKILQNAEFDNISERVFRLPIPKKAGYDLKWQGHATILQAALSQARKEMLMKAFQENKPFESNDDVTSSDFALSPGFEKIVGIEQNKDGTKSFVIRYGEYLNLLCPHAPRFENVQQKLDSTSVTLDKKALIDYLRYVFQEGFMLAKQQPVLLPSEAPLQITNNAYTLVLDRSRSMKSVFSVYKDNVRHLCQELLKICIPRDIIRIVDFDDNLGQDEAWVVGTDKKELLRKVSNHLRSLTIGEGTNLYGSVYKTLDSLKSKYPEYEHCLVVFTDGVNTDERTTEEQLIDKIQELTAPTATKPPRIFTLGLGPSYKREVVERWSKASGVSHIHLDKMSDFDAIYAEGAKMSRPRLLRHIVQGLFSEAVSVFNDSITLVPKALEEGTPFQFADKSYSFSRGPSVSSDFLEEAIAVRPSLALAYNAASTSQSKTNLTVEEDEVTNRLSGMKLTTRK